MDYIGRFAPSPTGPLHFGSLLAALASYLDARSHKGRWLLRIEDLDPPREIAGATDSIFRRLENFGLNWDETAVYQSDRHEQYYSALQQLLDNNLAYPCICSRQTIIQRSGSNRYDRHCYSNSLQQEQQCAVRSLCEHDIPFRDCILGWQAFPQQRDDFVIFRRDGFFAYQLAVTVDDAAQNISHIVRGSDLLDSTPKQLHLQRQLGYKHPEYAHIPVATNADGQKLSKQTYARALDDSQPAQQLYQALDFLGQRPPTGLENSSTAEILGWAVEHWDIEQIPSMTAIEWEG
ncbi:MAG: tRNA glutamyl-Q(34) synthetase GluQRS [Amphritea sp.]